MEIVHLDRSNESTNTIYKFINENECLLPDPFSSHVDLFQYSEKLGTKAETFISLDNGNVQGLVSGYINDFNKKEAYLQILIVKKEYQGKKVGGKLIRSFLAETMQILGKGAVVYLTVDVLNENAINFYNHVGFSRSERKHSNINKMILSCRV